MKQNGYDSVESWDVVVLGGGTAGTKSHYARAVQRCFQYIEAASLFFEDDIDRDGLSERLDIGKPGSDGKSV